MIDLRTFKTQVDVAKAAADIIVAKANEVFGEAGRLFSMVLSGGSTPKVLYELLASEGYRGKFDWSRVELYFGDERAVPPEHAESNFKMANESLISRVPVLAEHVHRMRGEGDPTEAGIEYGRMLKARFGEGGPDVTLLGMGNDGHTASLFPYTSAVKETHHRVVSHFVEKSTTGRSWRITMTAVFINRSALVLPLITGSTKADRLREVLYGPRDVDRLPIQLITPHPGKVVWLVDEAAAAALA